jgi:cardiolipin synthase (CMP-forming)
VLRHLPNLITGLRLVLVPVVWYYLWQREYERALFYGVIASASDSIDGYLARRLKAESRFGAIADPIADKALLSGSYLMFWIGREIPSWLPAIVIGRDVLILCCALFVWKFTDLRDFPPSVWGKLSTFIQIMTGLVILLKRSLGGDIYLHKLEPPTLVFCAVVTLWSGIHYAWSLYQRLGTAHRETTH